MLLGARQFFERRGAPTPPLPYDAEVEYLESTGTQYIDTGWIASLDTIVDLRFSPTIYMGGHILNGSAGVFQFYGMSQLNATNLRYGMWSGLNTGIAYTVGEIYDCRLDSTSGNKSVTINGVKVLENSGTAGPPSSSKSVKLFSNAGATSFGQCRIYGTKVSTINGVPILDLIPVCKNGVGYMYDRVTGQLLGNGGTGDFVLGPDKS